MSTVAVDPRFRARRIAVRRAEGRRRLQRLTVLIALLVVLVVAGIATRSPLLDVDEVRIDGIRRTALTSVLDATGIERGMPMVDVDPGAAARAAEALPWVADASVRRSWPGGVHVEIVERAPAAVLVGPDGTSALVDDEGWVLTAVGDAPDELPALIGETGPPRAGERAGDAVLAALATAAALPPDLAAAVASIESGASGLTLELRAGGRVRFGDVERLDEKVLALATVVHRVDLACLETLDVRIPPSPALTRSASCP